MKSYQIHMNAPYFINSYPVYMNAKDTSQPVAPENPQAILYISQGQYKVSDNIYNDSFSNGQGPLDGSVHIFDYSDKKQETNSSTGSGDSSSKEIQVWRANWLGRWKRNKWCIACFVFVLIVIGTIGGFVGFSLSRNGTTINNDQNDLNEKNDTINNNINNNQSNNNQSDDNNGYEENAVVIADPIQNYTNPNDNKNGTNDQTTDQTVVDDTTTTTTTDTSPSTGPNSNGNSSNTNSTNNTTTNYDSGTNNDTGSNTANNTANNTPFPTFSFPNQYLSTRQYICTTLPYSYCTNLPESVLGYIFATYSQYNKINSLLQLSKSFTTITNINQYTLATPLNKFNFTEMLKNIARSVECLMHLLPDTYEEQYQKLLNLQVDSQFHNELYLNLTEFSSGTPLKSSFNSTFLSQSCLFDIAPVNTSSARLLQTTSNNTSQSNCIQNPTEVLLYIHPYSFSPITVVKNIKTLQSVLNSTNLTKSLTDSVTSMGMWRKSNASSIISPVIAGFQQYLSQLGMAIPSKQSILIALKQLYNQFPSSSSLPSDFSTSTYQKLSQFFTFKCIQSLVSNYSDYEYARHKQFIIQQLNEGKKVIVIAHSEAAIYTNRVYQLLDSVQRNSVSLVYIAPSSKNMADATTNYITNPNDQIVQYLRNYAQTNSTFPSPLTPNMPATNFPSQVAFNINHNLQGYITAYKDKFLSLINTTRTNTVLPTKIWGTGPITATLLWDNQPDVDFHIFEPGGVHVYYEAKRGVNGYLDADDTFMYGPQHYYANCGLQQGNYTIKLNYYSGVSPCNVVVTVNAGSEYLIKSMELYPPMGKAGDSDPPYYVCTIMVRYNPKTNSNDLIIVQ